MSSRWARKVVVLSVTTWVWSLSNQQVVGPFQFQLCSGGLLMETLLGVVRI